MEKKTKSNLHIFWSSLLLIVFSVSCVPSQSQRSAYQGRTGAGNSTETYYSGYSLAFQPYKQCMITGRLDEVLQKMAQEEAAIYAVVDNDDEFARKMGLLGLFERSSLAVQAGDVTKTLYYSKLAEGVLEERESESYFSSGMASIGTMFTDVAGAGEYGRYDAVGYEKVMLLNLQAMAYLLHGDKRAFNVARKSILWQEEEKNKFATEIEKIEKENYQQQHTTANRQKNGTAQDKASIFTAIDNEFTKYNAKALTVPNAFVNPFGDFLAGTVLEFKSVEDKSLLSNAHISYKSALKLNPESRVLKRAVKDTEKKKSAERLIQLIAFDGFAPEKKVLSFAVKIRNLSAPLDIEIPTYEPIPSRVNTIKISTTGGKELTTLSLVADIETLALRHQKDILPALQATVVATTLRDAFIKELGNSLMGGLGTLVGSVMDSSMEPNTSSWMSLPSRILAGRFYSTAGVRDIRITTFDTRGKKLSEQILKLTGGGRQLIFIRSIDNMMSAYPSTKIFSSER